MPRMGFDAMGISTQLRSQSMTLALIIDVRAKTRPDWNDVSRVDVHCRVVKDHPF